MITKKRIKQREQFMAARSQATRENGGRIPKVAKRQGVSRRIPRAFGGNYSPWLFAMGRLDRAYSRIAFMLGGRK